MLIHPCFIGISVGRISYSSKWFLIDWEDASFAPTKGAPHLSQNEHSPNVYKDNHGADVDIWAVGRLICTTGLQVPPALRDIGQKMMQGHVLNAEQGLKEIRLHHSNSIL